LKDEIYKDCLDVKLSGKSRFWEELSKKWSYKNAESIRTAFRREAHKRGDKNSNFYDFDNQETYQEGNGYINIITSSDRIKTKEEIIKEFKIDTNVWKLDSFEVKTSEGYRKDRKVEWEVEDGAVTHGSVKDTGKMLVVPLYHVRAKFTQKVLEDITIEEMQKMFLVKEFASPMVKRKEYLPSNETLEIDITDTHFGSDANYAPEERFLRAIDEIVERIGKRIFKKIYVAILSDIFHYDTINKTTTAGTIVTTNGMTAYETFDLGLTTLITALQKISDIAPIEVIFIPGNHDRLSGYTLMKALEAYFRNNKNVEFDTGHKSRKHRVIGVNLVGWMHGDMPKARASNWLQVDAREEWGKTKYSEIHSGNYHSQQGSENGGVILRYLPGMTDIDQWHYDNGYVGSVRAMVSFIWHETKGMREMWFTNAS